MSLETLAFVGYNDTKFIDVRPKKSCLIICQRGRQLAGSANLVTKTVMISKFTTCHLVKVFSTILVSLEALRFLVCNDTKFIGIERKKSCLIIFEKGRCLAAFECLLCHVRCSGFKNCYQQLDQSFITVFDVVGNAWLCSL